MFDPPLEKTHWFEALLSSLIIELGSMGTLGSVRFCCHRPVRGHQISHGSGANHFIMTGWQSRGLEPGGWRQGYRLVLEDGEEQRRG